MKRHLGMAVVAAAASAVVFGRVAVAVDNEVTADCTSHPVVSDTPTGQKISVVCTVPNLPAATVTETLKVPGPTVTVTASAATSPVATPSAEPTTSSRPSVTSGPVA